MLKKMRKEKGFSLMEVTIVILIFSVLLAIVGKVCREYSTTITFLSERDLANNSIQTALEKIKSEIAESTKITIPVAGQSVPSPTLSFEKIDPTNTTRLPDTPPATLPSQWDPYAASYMVTVRYYMSGGVLIREATLPGKNPESLVLARGVAGFSTVSMDSQDNDSIRIVMSFSENSTIKTFTTQVDRKVIQ